ncbi:MAG TPA: RDD family protein, partial [Ardenticatenaceae bacterium]
MNYVEQPVGAPATQTIEVIGIGRRFVAYLIDSIITAIASSIAGFFLGLVFTASGGRPEEALTLNLLSAGLGFLITAAYFVAFWSATGQTIGN